MEQPKLIQMQEEDDAPPAGVYVVIDKKGKPHYGGIGRAADYLGVEEHTLRNLVLAALVSPENWCGKPENHLINRVARAFPHLFVDPFREKDTLAPRRVPPKLLPFAAAVSAADAAGEPIGAVAVP